MGKFLNVLASRASLRWAGTFPDVLAARVERCSYFETLAGGHARVKN